MADSIIGALRVVLGADTGSFEDGLKRAENQLSGFGKNIATIAAGIKLEKVIDAAIQGFKDAVVAIGLTVEEMDKLGKASQKIGVPVEELSALKYAAELADVSFESLTSTAVKLAKNMSEVAAGGTGPAAQAFAALNLSATNADGTLKKVGVGLGDIADRFSIMEDSTEKTALAVALFGKRGAELIPLLNQGREGIAAAAQEARVFGIIVSKEAAAAAEQFNDNLKRLRAINEGFLTQLATQLLPVLVKSSEVLIELSKQSNALGIASSSLGVAITGLTALLVVAVTVWSQYARNIQLAFEVTKAAKDLNLEGITKAFNDWTTASKDAGLAALEQIKVLLGLKDAVSGIDAEWREFLALQKAITSIQISAPNLIKTQKDALDQFIASTEKSIATINAEIAAFGLSAGARDRLRITMEAQAIATANNIKLTKEQIAEITRLGNEAEIARNKLSTMNKIEDALPAWQKYQKEIEKTREEFKSAGKSLEDFEDVNKRIAEKFGMNWDATATQMVDGWTKAFGTLAQENKKFAVAAKAMAITQALISTYTGAAKALEIGFPPFNFIAAAGVVAAGLAYVAQIAGLQFAKGGSFRVGGGMTGVDSEMVAFRASPGEMVDVRRPGQAGAGGGVQTINLNMPRPQDFFAQHIREMVTALNRAAPDGYILKVQPA
jgi:hypothetical protein